MAMAKGVWLAMSDGYVSSTGVAAVDDLLTRGGMSSMLVTIWLIITALSFGAILEHTGMLQRLVDGALKRAKSTGSLIATVVMSCIGINIVAADQYIAIVLPGKMYRAEFQKRGLDPKKPVAGHRRFRHADIAAGAVEYLRCIHGGDIGRCHICLSAIRIL